MRVPAIMAAVAAALLLVSVGCRGGASNAPVDTIPTDRLSATMAAVAELEVPAGADSAVWNQLCAELISALEQRRQGIQKAPSMLFPPGDLEEYHGVLSWSQNLIGDYDNNGEVNIADLTPLAVQFGQQVLPTDPAEHFRRRIDGDGNGEINLGDVTPIAVHFSETISGYAVLYSPTLSSTPYEVASVAPPTYPAGSETNSPIYYYQALEAGYYAVSPRGIGQSLASRTDFVHAAAFEPGVDPDPDPDPGPDPGPDPDPGPGPDPDPDPDPGPDPDPDPGTTGSIVSGQVKDTTGMPVANATVLIPGVGPILTNEDGYFVVSGAVNGHIAVEVRVNGYASGNSVMETVQNQERFIDVTVKAVKLTEAITAQTGGQISDNEGASVTIEPNSIVDQSGNPVTGQVNVSLTPIDVSQDAERTAAPTTYLAQQADDSEAMLQSFGMMEVSMTDELGYEVEVAENSEFEISIPVPEDLRDTAPESVGFYFYDEEQGIWVEAGEMSLAPTGDRFIARVRTRRVRPRWYNPDVPYITVTESNATAVGLHVTDTEGRPIKGVHVIANGVDYQGLTHAYSDYQGHAVIVVRRSSSFMLGIQYGGTAKHFPTVFNSPDDPIFDLRLPEAKMEIDQPFKLDPVELTFSLTWGELPRNLDSHLLMPYGTTENGGRLDLCPSNPGSIDAAFATHDLDSYGPEKIDLWELKDGPYEFIVENVDGWDSYPLEDSSARVVMSATGSDSVVVDIQEENPNQFNYWHVFTFRVRDHQITEVIERNQFLYLLPPLW